MMLTKEISGDVAAVFGKACFAAGTPVLTKTGLKRIETVYEIIGPDGKVFKIGESALGRTAEGLSSRAEAQVDRRALLQSGLAMAFFSSWQRG